MGSINTIRAHRKRHSSVKAGFPVRGCQPGDDASHTDCLSQLLCFKALQIADWFQWVWVLCDFAVADGIAAF